MTQTGTPRYAALGARIRRVREASGYSQERFAPLVGVSRRHLIRLEGGHHRPGHDLLARIALTTATPREELDDSDDSEDEHPMVRDLRTATALFVDAITQTITTAARAEKPERVLAARAAEGDRS